MTKSARLSDCRTFRYELHRRWGPGPMVAFIGLNPSTADETEDDPTIRRCIRYARDWGYDALCMVNLFAFRATDPTVMKKQTDPVGPDNLATLKRVSTEARMLIAAWGTHGVHLGQGAKIAKELPRLHCLSKTSAGFPGHPLYLKADLKPFPFNFVEEDWL